MSEFGKFLFLQYIITGVTRLKKSLKDYFTKHFENQTKLRIPSLIKIILGIVCSLNLCYKISKICLLLELCQLHFNNLY